MVQLTTQQPARHTKPVTKASSLAYVIFERPDLSLAEQYLADFGLTLQSKDADHVYMQAKGGAAYCYRVHCGSKARFVGFGFTVTSIESLEALAGLPEASEIRDSSHPGGGKIVSLRDPSGFVVEAIFGQSEVEGGTIREPLPLNLGKQTPRINETQRPPVTPPEILKLGHIVIEVADFQITSAWYTEHFGLIPSDVQVLPDGSPAVCFFRLDLGDTPADHHTLAMAQGFMACYSHSAYEVVDADAIGMGQRVLREKGWQHAWGMGRHILGSQIFDYWSDPWGSKHEHYCDGDLFTTDRPTGVHAVSREAMSQWGQPMPRSFTKPKINFAALRELVKNLRRSPDLNVKKLITLSKLFG